MSTTELASARGLVSDVAHARGVPVLRDILLLAAAGVLAAWAGVLLGGRLRVGLAMPLVGSVVVTFPRALILLTVLWRVNRAGVLTAAAVAEVLARLSMGIPGMLPTVSVVAVLAAAVGDAVWRGTEGWDKVWLRLAVTGAALAGTRVGTAWMLLVRAVVLPLGMRMPSTETCCVIVTANVLLGAAAGMMVAWLRRYGSGGR